MSHRIRLVFAAAVAGMLCLTLGLFAAYSASRPVVICASAPRKPFTTSPTSLITAEDYFTQGDYYYEQKDCDKAIADYNRALELNPSLAEAYNNRAYTYMVKRDYASALADLDRAIQLRPNYVNALMNRGDIYDFYYSIDYRQAVADYDQVIRIDPSAEGYTSVCGHRLLAVNHGWNLRALAALVTNGPSAGCPKGEQQ